MICRLIYNESLYFHPETDQEEKLKSNAKSPGQKSQPEITELPVKEQPKDKIDESKQHAKNNKESNENQLVKIEVAKSTGTERLKTEEVEADQSCKEKQLPLSEKDNSTS